MAYAATQAVPRRAYERELPQVQERPNFEVVEGSGLDALVRQGISPAFLAATRRIATFVLFAALLGAARVALCAQTLTSLTHASELRQDIIAAQALEADLKVTRSVLSNATRIERIASENYGMVLADEHETVWVQLELAETDESATDDLGESGQVLEAAIGAKQH